MKFQDFSGGGMKHENFHRRTECDTIAIASLITSVQSQIGKFSLIVVTQIKASQQYFPFGAILMFIMRSSNL